MSKISIRKAMLIYLIIYFVISGIYCGINGTSRDGEWDDYTYPTVTILEKHQIGICADDIVLIKEYFGEWEEQIEKKGISGLSGRTTRTGAMLTWYFPTYAIACIPMLLLLKIIGVPLTYTFTFTNLIVVMVALFVVFKCLKANDKQRLLLIILLSVNPIMFYYSWPSGETLIYSFLLIGLVFWYNGWYKRAAIFISLAGTMNTTIMSIGIIMIVEYMVKLIRSKGRQISWLAFVRDNLLDTIKYGSCYIVGLIPMIYFYYHTGYINLTASYDGFTQGKEHTWQRFLAYLFDLNYGILPYFPIILLFGFILVGVAIVKRHWRYLEWFTVFLINVFLYSMMVHINSGMSGIARYNAWGVLILIFAVCMFAHELVADKIANVGLWVGVLILSVIIYNYGPSGANKIAYNNWTPIARYVLDKVPGIYMPLHSTFNTRTYQLDGGYDYETPLVYIAEDGYVRKILASKKDISTLKNNYLSEKDDNWFNVQLKELENTEEFISVPMEKKLFLCAMYELGQTIRFQENEQSYGSYVVSPLSKTRSWGKWTVGNELRVRFRTLSEVETITCNIKCKVINESQTYQVFVNDEFVSQGIARGEDIQFDFANPGCGEPIDLIIKLPDAISKAQLGSGRDTKKLALGLQTIVFYEKNNKR